MERHAFEVIAPGNPHTDEFPVKVFSRNSSKRHRQYRGRVRAALKQPCDATLHRK